MSIKRFFISILVIFIALFIFIQCGKSTRRESDKSDAELAFSLPVEEPPALKVEISFPGIEKSLKPSILITFNKNITDEDNNLLVKEPVFKIDPDMLAKRIAVSANHIEYELSKDLKTDTLYKLSLNNSITIGSEDYKLDQDTDYFIKAKTAPLVRDAYIYQINRKDRLIRIAVDFNFTISPKFLSEKIFIKTKDNIQIPYTIESYSTDSVRLRVTNPPFDLKTYKHPVYIHVSKGVQSQYYDDLDLKADYVKAIDIPSNTSLMFYNYDLQEVGDKYNLILNFSDIIDDEDLEGFIEIKPDITTSMKSNYYSVIIEGDFTPETRVNLNIKPGLLSRNNNILLNGISQDVKFRNFSQMVGFEEKGTFIRKNGKKTLKFSYRNLDKVNIKVYRIFDNNIPVLFNFYKEWSGNLGSPDEKISFKMLDKDISLDYRPNQKHTHYLNFSELIDNADNGFYHIILSSEENYHTRDSMWLCITDIGLISKLAEDKLFVWAVSLESGKPQSNVDVSLFSLNNQQLAEDSTDKDGKVIFKGLKEYTDTVGIPFIVFARQDNDFSFIDIYTQSIDLSEYKTHGFPILKGDYNSYFFSERNLFRPGDTVNFGGIVRKRDLNQFTTVDKVPVKMEIKDSSHRLVTSLARPLDSQGTVEYQWKTSDYQETGYYYAGFKIGKIDIGKLTIQIEEFIPQRIQTLLNTVREALTSRDIIELTLKGLYLFGAPVSNGSYSLHGYLSPAELSIRGFNEYSFGYSDFDDIKPVELFRFTDSLDSGGTAEIKIDLNNYGIKQYSKIDIKAEIEEQAGGRTVDDSVSVLVNPYDIYLGIKKDDIDNIRSGKVNNLSGIVVNTEGKAIEDERDIDISVFHIEHRYIYYYDTNYGRHRYRFEEIENLIKRDSIKSENGKFSFDFNSRNYWGAYRITLTDRDTGSVTECTKYPWWWGYGTTADKNKAPYYIDLTLDKENALPGEKVEMVLNSPFNGRMLMTIDSDDVLLSEWHDIKKGHNTINFRVPPKSKDYNNVYVSAFIINSEYNYGSVPLRALGMANIAIRHDDNKLDVRLSHPEVIKPNTSLEIEYEIKNLGNEGRIAVFAVDEGILQIRKFMTPDPYAFFFSKTALGVKLNDILGMIMPEFTELYTGKTGYGDFEEMPPVPEEGDRGRIMRVKPLAFWSGFNTVSKDGKGTIAFDIPNFLGKVRVMAVAVSDGKFGSYEGFTIIRDKIQVISTMPRFLLAGDIFEIPITVVNSTGEDGEFSIDISAENIKIISFEDSRIPIKDNESKIIIAKASPEGNLGFSEIKIQAEGNGERTSAETTIPILPNSPSVTEYHLVECSKGETSLDSYTKGWAPEFERTFITLTSLVYSKELGYLKYLIRYPYGCLEQTISTAFPLLYLKDIDTVKEINEYLKDRDINQLILSAVSKVISMRIGDSGFGMWPSTRNVNSWVSVYATHFLYEANARGFLVDQSVLNSLADYITGTINIEDDKIHSISTRAYGYYVLSLMKKTRQNDIDFFLQRYRDRLLPESIAFIAGAYANIGNISMAKELISSDLNLNKGVNLTENDRNELQLFFYSELRQKGIILNVLMDMGQFADTELRDQLMLKIVQDLRTRKYVYYYSTQELVWSLRAFVKLLEQNKASGDEQFEGYLYKDGKEILSFTHGQRTVFGSGLTGHDLKILNKKDRPFYALLAIEGIKPGVQFTKYAQGIEIKRVFYDEAGNLLNQDDMLNLKQGQEIWAKIVIIAQSRFRNAAVTDRIGAGFEIENPRLTEQVLPSWIKPKDIYNPAHIDIKDHQISFFGDIHPGMDTAIFYKLKALTKGRFLIPPVSIEIMYDPTTRASDSAMNAEIK